MDHEIRLREDAVEDVIPFLQVDIDDLVPLLA